MRKRLVLRPDAYRVSIDGGVYFLGNQGPVRLLGASIAQWVDRLAPHLDGQHTLGDLTDHLPPERREMIERIVTTLLSRDVVRERDEDESSPPEDAEAARYAHEIAFLDYFRDSAAATFARFRTGTAVIVGTGRLLPAVVRATLRSGLRTVRIATTGDQRTDRAQLAGIEEEARRHDPDQGLVRQSLAGSGAEELAELVVGVDLVLQVVDDRPGADTRPLERACARASVPLAQAVAREEEAWLVPIADPGTPGWSAARPRLRPAAPLRHGNPPETPGGGGPAAATVVASQLVQGAFRVLTGVGAARDPDRLVRVDFDTLRSEERRFLAHPFALPASALTEADFRARVAELTDGERLTEATFSQRASRCVDDRLGIITLHEHDWAQSPLYVTEARAHPAGPPGETATISTTQVGLTYQAARVAATMRALAFYAERTVDPRRLIDHAARPLVTRPDDPNAALTALRASSALAMTWGYEVTDPDQVRLVSAPKVFPTLGAPAPPAEATAGLAAGLDWDGAVLAGLLDHCNRLTLAEIGHRATPYPAVDLATQTLDTVGTHCRDLLAALGELPEVHMVTGSLGVPTYAFCFGPDTVAYATAESRPSAMASGLIQVLRTAQAQVHGQPTLAPPPVPNLPDGLRGRPEDSVDAENYGRWGVPTLAHRLRKTGRVAVAVPLDHDPQLGQIMPYLVQVVLCDD